MIDTYHLQQDENVINSYLKKINTHSSESYVELAWDSALFFSKIILDSQNYTFLSESTVQAEIAGYNRTNGTDVSLDYLLDRFWLRKIFGQIKISGAILRLFLSGEIVEIPKDYNDGVLLKNFCFLEYLVKKYKYEDSRICEISTQKFESIYAEFKAFYSQMPDLDTLLQDYQITKKGDKYVYRLWLIENKVNQKALSTHILYSLLKDNDPSNDAECLKKWLVATKFIDYLEELECFSDYSKERYLKAAKELLKIESDLDDGHENEKFLLNEDLRFCSFDSAKDIILKKGLSNYTIKSKDPFVRWMKIFSNRENGVDLLDYYVREECVKLLQSLLIYSIKNPGTINLLDLFENKSYLLYQTLFYLARYNPAHLLLFIDNMRYGLIFFCSFLLLCEDSFVKRNTTENVPFSLVGKYVDLFCEKKLINNANYRDASLLLMFLIERMYNSECKALYCNIYEKICVYSFFENPKKFFLANALDCYTHEAENIWICRIPQIKICNFKYLFFFYIKAEIPQRNQYFELIKSLYEESVLKNEKFSYWREWNEIDSLEWNVFFCQLFELGELKDFCLNIFNYISFDKNEIDFDKKYSGPKKLRLHLKLLCSVYSEWRKYEGNEKNKLLEECIVKILQKCFVNRIEEKKIAIFDLLYESHWGVGFKTELFPQVIDVLMSFSESNRKSVLLAMSKGDDLKLMIKAYNLIDNENDQNLLKELMDFSIDVERSISFFDDYIFFLRDLYNSHINNELADRLYERLDKNIEQRANGQIVASFVLNAQILKLYSMFWHGDENGLSDYKCPYKDVGGRFKDGLNNLENERCFLLTLMYIKNGKNEDAQRIVKRIRCQDSDFFALKYKSFALYLSIFDSKNNSNSAELLKQCDALIELSKNKMWAKEKISYDGLQYLYYAKVRLLEKIGDCDKLYRFYNSVEDDYRAVFEFAKPVVTCLFNQGRNVEAIKVCNTIRPSEKENQEYETLKESIPAEDEISRLTSSYKDILCLSKKDRFKVLPDVVCKHRKDAGSFVICAICFCLDKILGKIQSLKLLSEDNKTDLIQIMLESYLKMLNYEFDKDQTHQGLSASKKQAGELDLVLNFDTYSVVVEAVRCCSLDKNVKEHISKMFNYDASKSFFVNLMYYEGDNLKFSDHWQSIVLLTSNNKDVVYPSNYSCLSSEDISDEFNNASIKVLKNTHENGLVFYHIFVNLNYAD